MRLIESDDLQSMVDYSFGDHSGVLGGIPQAFMKKANRSNREFFEFVYKNTGRIMTLFIDNIRLYKRPLEYSDWLHMKPISSQDRLWLKQFEDEDLLSLCSEFPHEQFIIFTALEDTPLDESIKDRIPDNVIAINAANAVYFGGKVKPYPHGLERKMYRGYIHHELLLEALKSDSSPSKLLFVAHRTDTGDRKSIGALFEDKDWATVTHLPYEQYLQGIKDHKFVLCPSGNGIESARNWETLYMKRVPIFKRHSYLEMMFKNFPCVFVDDFSEITEQFLKDSEWLFDLAQKMNMDLLDLDKIFFERIKL